MILLDSLYINKSGGEVLLDYLVKNIEKEEIDCFYLFDIRGIDCFDYIPENRKIYLKASIFNRYKFYKKNINKFEKVICFANLPPFSSINRQVYTYFHQPMFLSVPAEFSFIKKISFMLKTFLLGAIIDNTNYWLVQSDHIKVKLQSKFNISPEKIEIIPFFPSFNTITNITRRKHTYIYVSTASPHKNHIRLIAAFCKFYDKYKIGELILTISDDYKKIIRLINLKNDMGYPIKNIGYVTRENLVEFYQSSEFSIYPSLAESFGLGIVEAIENGCNIIGADLPYTYSICKPSIIFNPSDVNSIFLALENSININININIKPTEQFVQNEIAGIIEILKN
ncbi:MAG: glycosyltransferase [Bacteroidota bacterium]|nr:glycosyltransferase [Bacteroidota bacterium]